MLAAGFSRHPADMRSVTVFTVILGVSWCYGQFLNNRPYPTYSLEHMPDTTFSCREKVLGGYYADSETQCQMFHVCVKVAGLGVQDFRFLCPNGTAFDQDSQICADWDDVDCEAATLYYSSDNFDLYRIGSAFPGEEEDTFHLQRSETGDARLNREHQAVRVNQKADYNTPSPLKPVFHKERELFRGSSSSNFFNNRNGGKETDEDYDDGAPNQTADLPKKKIIRKFNRKPDENQYDTQTQRSNRPTGFVNNFAGSSYSTTVRTTTTTAASEQYSTQNYYRGRQGARRGGERQYNNAENFRNNNNNQYNPPVVSSTPAPFRQAPERQYKNLNRQNYDNPTTASPKPTYNQNDNRGRQNNNYEAPTQAPASKSNYNQYDNSRSRQNYDAPTPTSSKPNYNQGRQNYDASTLAPSKPNYNQGRQNFDASTLAPSKSNYNQGRQNYDAPTPPPARTTYNQYESTRVRQQQYETPTTTAPRSTYNQYDTPRVRQQSDAPTTSAPSKQTYNQYRQSDSTTTTPYQKSDYSKQAYKKETENYPTTIGFPSKQYEQKKQTTQYKQTENYPTTYAPSKQFQKQTTQYFSKQTENYPSSNKQSTQNEYKPSTQSTTQRPTTQHTQYTPTVPKQTTHQFATSTPNNRYSKPYDDNYDDGSYNPKYDDDKYKSDDEFLKTAHSINIASSRNEYSESKVSTQSPRPFSVTTPVTAKPTAAPQNVPKVVKQDKPAVKTDKSAAPKKTDKNESYDYAYYDTNVGSEPDYDVGTEFAKHHTK